MEDKKKSTPNQPEKPEKPEVKEEVDVPTEKAKSSSPLASSEEGKDEPKRKDFWDEFMDSFSASPLTTNTPSKEGIQIKDEVKEEEEVDVPTEKAKSSSPLASSEEGNQIKDEPKQVVVDDEKFLDWVFEPISTSASATNTPSKQDNQIKDEVKTGEVDVSTEKANSSSPLASEEGKQIKDEKEDEGDALGKKLAETSIEQSTEEIWFIPPEKIPLSDDVDSNNPNFVSIKFDLRETSIGGVSHRKPLSLVINRYFTNKIFVRIHPPRARDEDPRARFEDPRTRIISEDGDSHYEYWVGLFTKTNFQLLNPLVRYLQRAVHYHDFQVTENFLFNVCIHRNCEPKFQQYHFVIPFHR